MSALFCLTPSLECCSDSETPNAASVTREWYLPDGRPVAFDNSPFIKSQVSSAVTLHCDRFSDINTALAGMYRCEIPDASGTSQNIYVGIYPQGSGDGELKMLITIIAICFCLYYLKLIQVLPPSYLSYLTETRRPLPVPPLVVLLPLSLGGRMVSQWTYLSMSRARGWWMLWKLPTRVFSSMIMLLTLWVPSPVRSVTLESQFLFEILWS